MFSEIATAEVYFPEEVEISDECKTFIWDLLDKEPSKRLGFNGFEEVIKHEYMQDVDFEKIANKEYPAPYMPELSEDVFDITNL
jgi:serum/glucocorticoid-regulated kinase 2